MTDEEPTYEQRSIHALAVAERIMEEVLPAIRMLTPDGWEMAANYASIHERWHTLDVTIMRELRLASMRAGRRFGPPYERPASRPEPPDRGNPSRDENFPT